MAPLADQIPNIGAKNTQATLMHMAIKLTISATGNHVGSPFSDAADSTVYPPAEGGRLQRQQDAGGLPYLSDLYVHSCFASR